MPVEIRELHITTVVQDSNNAPQASTPSTSRASSNPDAVIAACVEQVLEILKQKNER